MLLNRRQNLAAAVAALVALVWRKATPAAAADPNIVDQLINQFTGGRTPVSVAGKITFGELPDSTDNGNVVPLTVSVDGPMTEDSYVAAVLVLADGNARPAVATFYFSPESGEALASTRIRLAKPSSGPQTVIAVARMKGGACFKAEKQVDVTVSGCG